jgi:hypothetical protein
MAFLKTIPIIALIATAPSAFAQTTFYVNGSCGDDAWTGTSSACEAPSGPKRTIQAGIEASVNGDTVIVADGTYIGVGNKNLNYGGRLITLRSENGPAVCIIDCENDGRGFWFHSAETADAVLEGFTIRNGNVAAWGGAILCESASPTILNCVLANNRSTDAGGGMFNMNSSPTVTDCTFTNNTAGNGGGMYNITGSSPTVTRCTFGGNHADRHGGGMANYYRSSPMVTNCTFSGNSARFRGGGMYNERRRSSPIVTNCTFSGNSTVSGGGMYSIVGASPVVTNSIFWNDSPDEIVAAGTAITTVRFSDVQGGWPGTGNIALAPRFQNRSEGGFRLKPISPCIDAADNTAVPASITTDLDGNPRFVDDPNTPDTGNGAPPIVDMGAYEFQAQCQPCDMNCDGDINAFDIDPFLDLLFGPDPTPCDPAGCTGDVNGDGVVDEFDIEPFLECLFP